MEQVKHTPGPWSYRPRENDDWGMVRGPDGRLVAALVAQPERPWAAAVGNPFSDPGHGRRVRQALRRLRLARGRVRM